MIDNKYEVRIKHEGDYEIPWEEIKPEIHYSESQDILEIGLADMACNPHNEIWEIRFNRVGSSQGHYVPGSKLTGWQYANV